MERILAAQIRDELTKECGAEYFTLLEVMNMTRVMTDDREIYAIGKGDVTAVAWVQKCGRIVAQVQRW